MTQGKSPASDQDAGHVLLICSDLSKELREVGCSGFLGLALLGWEAGSCDTDMTWMRRETFKVVPDQPLCQRAEDENRKSMAWFTANWSGEFARGEPWNLRAISATWCLQAMLGTSPMFGQSVGVHHVRVWRVFKPGPHWSLVAWMILITERDLHWPFKEILGSRIEFWFLIPSVSHLVHGNLCWLMDCC